MANNCDRNDILPRDMQYVGRLVMRHSGDPVWKSVFGPTDEVNGVKTLFEA